VKAAFAILFSAFLLIGQGLVPAERMPAKPEPQCDRCACGGSCCVGKSAPASAPVPATPTTVVSLKQFPLALAIAAQVLSPPVLSATTISPAYFLSRSEGIPLYQRDCARLI
jgi:hypothetical protein